MERPLWFRWLRVYAVGAAISGLGVVLYMYATPTDEQLINSLSPELRAQYEREKNLRRREQEELIKIVKKTSASNDPIWKTGPLENPLENNKKGLVLKELIEREEAEKSQQDELLKIRQELEEAQAKTRQATDEQLKKKSWFSWR